MCNLVGHLRIDLAVTIWTCPGQALGVNLGLMTTPTQTFHVIPSLRVNSRLVPWNKTTSQTKPLLKKRESTSRSFDDVNFRKWNSIVIYQDSITKSMMHLEHISSRSKPQLPNIQLHFTTTNKTGFRSRNSTQKHACTAYGWNARPETVYSLRIRTAEILYINTNARVRAHMLASHIGANHLKTKTHLNNI